MPWIDGHAMTTVTKMSLILALLGALLTAICGFGWVSAHRAEKAAEGRAVAAEQALKTQAQVDKIGGQAVEHTNAARQEVTKAKEKADVELQEAREASPDWADAPVPSDVLSVLRD